MQKSNIKRQYLLRDGQNQNQRFPKELDPYYARVDDKTRKDLLLYAEEISKDVNFYNTINNTKDGNWSAFFEKAWTESNAKIKNYGKHKAHLALYLAFLIIYRHAQKSINKITKRHLDFYYKEILKLSNKKETSDKVHVLFELKKGVDEQLIEEDTYLKGSDDSKGNTLLYKLKNDIIVNTASVAKIKSIYVDKKNNCKILSAPIAKSADGLGEELDDGDDWDAFGNSSLHQSDIGFAVASDILKLKEGLRKVILHLSLESTETVTEDDFKFTAYFTGEKGWIGPIENTVDTFTDSNNNIACTLQFILEEDDELVTSYSSEIHSGTYETSLPMMQVFLKNTTAIYGYKTLQNLKIRNLKISVDVSNVKELELENDQGKLNYKKPFMPFGTEPAAGSIFYIGSEEAFSKNIDSFKLHAEWKNIPNDDLADYYKEYKNGKLKIVGSNKYFTATLVENDNSESTIYLFKNKASEEVTYEPGTEISSTKPPVSQQFAGLNQLLFMSNRWALSQRNRLALTSKVISTSLSKRNAPQFQLLKKAKNTYVQIKLNKGFLHKEYRKFYTEAVVEYAKSGSGGITLPNEPYTPEMQSIKLDYTASTREENLNTVESGTFLNSEVEFYHITPFGQRREHKFLKSKLKYDVDESTYLLHQYPNQGELYIGIKEAEAESEIPLLFQLAEGSADPESEKVKLQWEVLAEDHWRQFNETEIVSDTTNELLTSGIIRFTLPKEATTNDTLLDSGYHWIRTYLPDDTKAVCKFIDIETNACLAEFENNKNDLTHLKTSLPAKSIKKLDQPVTTIKKITQPYASFGGAPKESDTAFYTRVSERLRHKGRAINIWDYERLILQNFPNVHKVKCIPHCSKNYEFSPGSVTIVVIPILTNKNAVNKLQPKVDLNTMDEIKEFILKRTNYFADINVQNPEYEEVQLAFKVKMRKGYPFGYYSNILQEDIVEYLCPWLSENPKEISFEGTIHKSVLLHYIENRKYIDYLTDFKMYHILDRNEPLKDIDSAHASKAVSILVSSLKHSIESV